MLLEVQHRGDSRIIDCRRSRPNADGVGLPLSHSREQYKQSHKKRRSAPWSVVQWVLIGCKSWLCLLTGSKRTSSNDRKPCKPEAQGCRPMCTIWLKLTGQDDGNVSQCCPAGCYACWGCLGDAPVWLQHNSLLLMSGMLLLVMQSPPER